MSHPPLAVSNARTVVIVMQLFVRNPTGASHPRSLQSAGEYEQLLKQNALPTFLDRLRSSLQPSHAFWRYKNHLCIEVGELGNAACQVVQLEIKWLGMPLWLLVLPEILHRCMYCMYVQVLYI